RSSLMSIEIPLCYPRLKWEYVYVHEVGLDSGPVQMTADGRVTFGTKDSVNVRPAILDLSGPTCFHRMLVLGRNCFRGVALRHIRDTCRVDCADKRHDGRVGHAFFLYVTSNGLYYFLTRLDGHKKQVALLGGEGV